MRCPKCGTESPDTTKFCPECGTALRRPEIGHAGERRHVTVFFGDLVGSTALSESMDPEQLHDLYSEYQSICNDVTRRYDGHIAHYLGDGVVAFFGYPTAHEDDAVRAVRSGLEIVERVERLRAGAKQLHIRVAIHTGVVVVGEVGGAEQGEQMVSGEVPNIAARLQAEAEPDTVLISDATRRLVEGHFLLEDRGSRRLKGISRPIRAFRVVRDGEAESRFDASASKGLAPFTGREREVEVIRTLWSRAKGGPGEALLLCGEAGIGKSRLLGVAREAAETEAHELFGAQCSPYHTNSDFYPIIQTLQRRLELRDGKDQAAQLAALERFVSDRGNPIPQAVPLLAGLLGIPIAGPRPEMELSALQRRKRIIDLLTGLLLRSGNRAPVLILMEDIHWADPSTLELIGRLIDRRADAPVLVALTTRYGPDSIPEIAAKSTVVQVEALPREDTRALLDRLVGKRLPEDVAREIIVRTGGVPLFLEAVTRTILESGILRELGDRFELNQPLPEGLIPATVHDSLMARVDRLGPHKPIAQLAAAIGREFSYPLLQSVADLPEHELAQALERMVDLDLVSRHGQPPRETFIFKHALVQDAAYDSLLKRTRQEFHGRIAAALVQLYPDIAQTAPDLLARHTEGAGRLDEAIDHWTAAGILASHRSAERESVAHLRKALSLVETRPPSDPDRVRREMVIQLALGPALMATQGWASREVEAACTRARELCDQTQNTQGLVGALWGLWTVLFVRGELDPALEAAQSVLAMAEQMRDPILLVAARHGVGFTRYFRGEFGEARVEAEKGLELFDLARERQLVQLFQISSSVCCLMFLAQSLRLMGYPDAAVHQLRRMEKLLEDLDSPTCTLTGLGIGMYHDLDLHDFETVLRKADRGYSMAVELGSVMWTTSMRVYRGWARSLNGDSTSGVAELRAGLDEYVAIGAGLSLSAQLMMLGEALRADGQLDEALQVLARGLAEADRRNERYFEAELHRLRGEILIDRGALHEAEAELREALRVSRAQRARLLELRSTNVLARLLIGADRPEEAESLLRPQLEWFSEGVDSRELTEARGMLEALESGVP